MTGEEMEPDIDPPLLPLQGARLRRASAENNTPSLSTSTLAPDSRRTARPAPRHPPHTAQKGDVSKLPSSLRPATRVASQVQHPQFSAVKPIDRIFTAPAVPAKPPQANQRTRGPPPTKFSRTAPLLPLSERKQGQNTSASRPRTNPESERWDITPDGGSAGREGRRFAVSNVGNNGRIYLRYVLIRLQSRVLISCDES